ncbi:MAG: BrnT family toxin [Pyrinomonadaceae bacterium]
MYRSQRRPPVFFDPLSLTVADPTHSLDEKRFVITGLSYQGRHLLVAHADRGDRIRTISARLATPPERKKYESGLE